MRILLDTHIFLWFISGDPQLSISTREIIQDSAIRAYDVSII
jgi:PIN domain nuclease of toxin-antitoxin system